MDLYGTDRADTLTGGAGDDILYGFGGDDTLKGGAGNDVLAGHAGNDRLQGGDGDDYLLGGAGDDLIDGGGGTDWASYEDATAGVKVDLTKAGVVQDTGGGGQDTLVGIENLYGSRFSDVLTGDDRDNYIYGGEGDNDLIGGKGDDHLSAGSGANYFFGGEGFDTVDFAASGAGVTVDIKTIAPPHASRASVNMYFSIEAVMGSHFDDAITGNSDANYLFGDQGDDVLRGVGGGDTLDGGDGNDMLYASANGTGDLLIGDLLIGGRGRDVMHGGDGADVFLFNPYDTAWRPENDAAVDVIEGFQRQDKLSFQTDGQRIGPQLLIKTSPDWLSAVMTAPMEIHAHRIAYVAVQVGNDTYVFASGPTTGESMVAENVVKLVGVQATDLTLENFA